MKCRARMEIVMSFLFVNKRTPRAKLFLRVYLSQNVGDMLGSKISVGLKRCSREGPFCSLFDPSQS